VASHFALYTALTIDVLRNYPLVVHFHGPWFAEAAEEGAGKLVVTAKRLLEVGIYRRAERIVVLSHAFGELLAREFGVAEDRVRIVPGHVDIARFSRDETRAEARLLLGLPMDRPILLTVRRLARRMGLDRLIAAMPAVLNAQPDVLLCIAGRGSLGPILQRQVQEIGLEHHVCFLGFVPEKQLPLVYRAADLNVLPSVALEGFGLAAAEALAAGTPSLVSPVGGLPEVVAPLSPALVFRSTAVADIALGLITALREQASLPDEVACRAYAAARFPAALAAKRVAAVYRELA
jgi:glycosyltransferase involved in cell wall biosynthesis